MTVLFSHKSSPACKGIYNKDKSSFWKLAVRLTSEVDPQLVRPQSGKLFGKLCKWVT